MLSYALKQLTFHSIQRGFISWSTSWTGWSFKQTSNIRSQISQSELHSNYKKNLRLMQLHRLNAICEVSNHKPSFACYCISSVIKIWKTEWKHESGLFVLYVTSKWDLWLSICLHSAPSWVWVPSYCSFLKGINDASPSELLRY